MINELIAALIPILCMIESGNDSTAVGDNGKAIGILQIHRCVVDDVNRIYSTDFRYVDRLNTVKSRRICALYLRHYAKLYDKPNVKTLAMIWNGGPKGPQKDLRDYWAKVSMEFLRQRPVRTPHLIQ